MIMKTLFGGKRKGGPGADARGRSFATVLLILMSLFMSTATGPQLAFAAELLLVKSFIENTYDLKKYEQIADTIEVSDLFTTHIFFPSKIMYAKVSNEEDVFGTSPSGKSNVLYIQARRQFCQPCNLTVLDEDGIGRVFILRYNDHPKELLVEIANSEAANPDELIVPSKTEAAELAELSDKYRKSRKESLLCLIFELLLTLVLLLEMLARRRGDRQILTEKSELDKRVKLLGDSIAKDHQQIAAMPDSGKDAELQKLYRYPPSSGNLEAFVRWAAKEAKRFARKELKSEYFLAEVSKSIRAGQITNLQEFDLCLKRAARADSCRPYVFDNAAGIIDSYLEKQFSVLVRSTGVKDLLMPAARPGKPKWGVQENDVPAGPHGEDPGQDFEEFAPEEFDETEPLVLTITAKETHDAQAPPVEENAAPVKDPYYETIKTNLSKRIDIHLVSVRTYNVLRASGIFFLGDLVQRSRKDISKIRGIGRISLNELDFLLKKNQLRFGMDVEAYGYLEKKKDD